MNIKINSFMYNGNETAEEILDFMFRTDKEQSLTTSETVTDISLYPRDCFFGELSNREALKTFIINKNFDELCSEDLVLTQISLFDFTYQDLFSLTELVKEFKNTICSVLVSENNHYAIYILSQNSSAIKLNTSIKSILKEKSA